MNANQSTTRKCIQQKEGGKKRHTEDGIESIMGYATELSKHANDLLVDIMLAAIVGYVHTAIVGSVQYGMIEERTSIDFTELQQQAETTEMDTWKIETLDLKREREKEELRELRRRKKCGTRGWVIKLSINHVMTIEGWIVTAKKARVGRSRRRRRRLSVSQRILRQTPNDRCLLLRS